MSEPTRKTSQPGDSPTLRVGIAGLGIAARQALPSFKKVPNAVLTAVADTRPEALTQFREQLEVETFDSVASMCRSDAVDAVWITTPNVYHAEHTIVAAENGKHMICEKPMAVSLEECDAMIAAIERSGVKYVQGHSKIYERPIRAMREIVESGDLGRVIQINAWNYNDWLLRPRLASEVDTRLGGGILYRQGPHLLDIVRFLGGGLVRSVRGQTGRYQPGFDTEGNFSAFLEFEDGTAATLAMNGYGNFPATELTWNYGEGGQIVPDAEGRGRREIPTGPIEPTTKYNMPRYNAGHEREAVAGQSTFGITVVSCERGDIRQSPRGLYVYTAEGRREVPLPVGRAGGELAELYEAVTQGRPAFPDARWGKATLEACIGILDSSRQRREVLLQHQVPVPYIHERVLGGT